MNKARVVRKYILARQKDLYKEYVYVNCNKTTEEDKSTSIGFQTTIEKEAIAKKKED